MAESHVSNTSPGPDSIEAWATNHIARSQSCPVCLGSAVAHDTRKNGRVMLATYACTMRHRWNVTWVLGQVAE